MIECENDTHVKNSKIPDFLEFIKSKIYKKKN